MLGESIMARQDLWSSKPSKAFGVLKRGFGVSVRANLGFSLGVVAAAMFVTTIATVIAN